MELHLCPQAGAAYAGVLLRAAAFLVLLLFPAELYAEVQVLAPAERPVLFAGQPGTFQLPVANRAAQSAEYDLEIRVFQLTSNTSAPVGPRQAWRKVSLLPGQTALETVEISLPEIRAATIFRVLFYDGAAEVGRCNLIAIPQGILSEFAERKPIFLAPPESELAAALKKLGVKYQSANQIEDRGVVLAGPFSDQAAVKEGRSKVRAWTERGSPVILLVADRELARAEAGGVLSLTGVLFTGAAKVVHAKHSDLKDLATSAKAQFALWQLLTLATQPEIFPWFGIEE